MSARQLPGGYRIRPREAADDPFLVAVEKRAAEQFRAHGYSEIADVPVSSVENFAASWAGHDVLVAVDPNGCPIGFAASTQLDGFLHLAELSVDPDHGRIGVGGALVDTVCRMARDRNLAGVTLTTFRDVPFNAPFYAKLGFVELPLAAASDVLQGRFLAEVPPGVGAETRLLMVRSC